MAGIRKREWTTAKGVKKVCYEVTYCVNGKLCRKSGFKTKIEAQEALPQITKVFSNNILVEELARAYIDEHCALHCKDGTIKLYNAYLKNNLATLQRHKAKAVSKRMIDLLILEWKEKGLSNKTMNNILGFMYSFFQYGVKNKWISENPIIYVNKLPKTSKVIKFLTEKEIQEFVSVIKQFPIERYAPLLTALYTGMRISELIALEWSDIDLENNTILVNKQFYRGKLTTTKTLSSIRRVSVPDIVIKTLLQLRKQTKVLSSIVFCGSTGQYINTTKFVENWFKKAARAIGKPDFNFHALRHTYATLLLSKSVSLKFVQEQLGHSTAQTTLNVYSHVLPSVNKKAMNILNNLKLEHDLSMGSPEYSKTALQSGSKWSG